MIKIFLVRVIKLLVVLFLLLTLVAFAAPKFIDLKSHLQKVIAYIEKESGNKVSIKDDITLSIFPQVKITLPNVHVYNGNEKNFVNVIQANKVIVTMPLTKFFFGDREPDTIEIQEAKINRDQRADSVDNVFASVKRTKLKSFIITNSLSYSQAHPEQEQYTKINVRLDFGSNDNIKFLGSVFQDNKKVNIEGVLGSGDENSLQPFDINIKSEDADLVFQGKVKQGKDNSLENFVTFNVDQSWEVDGNVNITVRNPVILVKHFARVMPFLVDMEKNSSEEDIKLSANISYIDGFLDAKDINISSSHTNGNGNLSFNYDDLSNMKLKFDFESIDINHFITFSKTKELLVSDDEVFIDTSNLSAENSSYLNFSLLNQKDVDLNLTSKKVTVQEVSLYDFNFNYKIKDKKINDGILEFDISNNELNSKFLISKLTFSEIAGTTVLLGSFSNNGNNINKTLELFGLRDYINLQEDNLNYSVGSKIIFAPKEISIFEIDGSIGENGKISGSIATKQDVINDYKVNLKISNLELDNFELPLFKSRLESLLKDSDDDRYLSKFIWFRTLDSTYDIKFAFENTKLDKQKIDNLTVLCRLVPSNMSIKGKIYSDFAESHFSLDLTAFTIKPSLAIKVTGNNLDYDVFNSLLFGFLKKDSDYKQPNNQIWSEEPINLFSIYKYAANFDIGFKSLKVKEQEFEDFQFIARTAGDSLYVDNLEMNVYGGKFQTRGNISFFNQILCQFSFSGVNLEVKDLLSDISPKLNAFNGPISVNGSLVVGGNTVKELIGSLNLSTNFISSNINIKGINSDEVVDIALQRKKIDKDKVLSLVESSLNEGMTEILSLSGDIKSQKGIIQSNNITLKSRFTSAISAIYFDLNNMILSSNSQFLFLPYNDTNPISYNVLISGDLNGELKRKIDDAKLLKYIKGEYDIVTNEDILEARRRNREIARQRSSVIDSSNDKNYLYYKLQEEIRVKQEKEQEEEELKKLNEANPSNQ